MVNVVLHANKIVYAHNKIHAVLACQDTHMIQNIKIVWLVLLQLMQLMSAVHNVVIRLLTLHLYALLVQLYQIHIY